MLRPYAYQATAVHDVAQVLATADRAQLVAACGTGKSLMGVWTAAALRARRTIAFAPSLAAVGSLLKAFQAGAESECLVVCSDQTIAAYDPGFPVTTDPKLASEFWAAPLDARLRVVISTYQSLEVVQAMLAAPEMPRADLLVLDEAHRLAGPEDKLFGRVLRNEAVPGNRRLLMTATPKVFATRHARDAEEVALVSMDDPALFGPVAHRISFGEAIRLGLIADYQVDVLGVTEREVRGWLENPIQSVRTLAQAAALRRAFAESRFRYALSFHGSVRNATDFQDAFIKLEPHISTGAGAWAVFAQHTAEERAAVLARMSKQTGVVASVRVFSESMDLPAVDAAVIVDPKSSQIDIVQCVGRALRLDPETPGKIAHVVVPVLLKNGESPSMEGGEWEPLWNVLGALRAHDERMALALDQENARRKESREEDPAGVEALGSAEEPDPTRSAVALLDGRLVIDFGAEIPPARTINRLIHDVRLTAHARLADTFIRGLESVEYLRQTKGAVAIGPDTVADGFEVGRWMVKLMRLHGAGELAPEDVATLQEQIPEWREWLDNPDIVSPIGALEQYVARVGSLDVPRMYRARGFIDLRGHIVEWQAARRAGTLDPATEKRLEALPGWIWETEDPESAARNALLRRVERVGSARVQRHETEGRIQLGAWAAKQRKRREAGRMPEEEARWFEGLPGWTWQDPTWQSDRWWTMLERVHKAAHDHGGLDAAMPELGEKWSIHSSWEPLDWIRDTLRDYANGRLTSDLIVAAEGILGWTWSRDPVSVRPRNPGAPDALVRMFADLAEKNAERPFGQT